VNDFYSQGMAIRTSKQVAGDIKKAAKEANRVQRMETEFQPNEQLIKDMATPRYKRKSPNSKLLKTNSFHANSPTLGLLPAIPDLHPEAGIKPNLVIAHTGKRLKRHKVVPKCEIHKHLVNTSVVLHSLVVVLLAGVANHQKCQKPCRWFYKIDQRDQYNKWLDTLANTLILDPLLRNLEFHNISQVILNTMLSQTLSLGLKLRPTLKPHAAHVFENQIQDFCRSVRLHRKYADKAEDPDFSPKLYVKLNRNPPREDPDLEENRIRYIRSY